jgi:hypothetical protein
MTFPSLSSSPNVNIARTSSIIHMRIISKINPKIPKVKIIDFISILSKMFLSETYVLPS